MSSDEQTSKSALKICRICQEDELESDSKLLKPCKCNSHIHKECLLTWIKTKINSDIIDYQNDLQCEICLTKIKYAHASNDKTDSDETELDNGKTATILNMSKILFKRNENVLKNVMKGVVFIFIPLFLIIGPIFFLQELIYQKTTIVDSKESFIELLKQNEFSVRSYYTLKIAHFLNSKYFPEQFSRIFIHMILHFMNYLVALVPLIEDSRNGFNTSTLHKMYEYEFGVEKAITEYEKIQKSISDTENASFANKCVNYFKNLTISVPMIVCHIILQEFIPRYIYFKFFENYSQQYEHYFSVFYNFVVLGLAYLYLVYQQNNRANSSYVLFVVKNSLKLVICLYWQSILIYFLELVSLKYLKVDQLIRLNVPFEFKVYQSIMLPTFKVLQIVLLSLSYLRKHIFRYGVFYKFPTGLSDGNQLTHTQLVLINPLLGVLAHSVFDFFIIALTLLSIGGSGLVGLYRLKPDYFPLVFDITGIKGLILENIVSSVLSFQISVLKDVVYVPLFQKLGAFFKLSNYLFDYDRPLEKGRFVYRDCVDINNVTDMVKAKSSNTTLFERPCFSHREALYLLEKGDASVNAYFIQEGYNIKVPNASSIISFQEGLMKPADSSGNTIIKSEEKSEEELLAETNVDSDVEVKTTKGLFEHAYNNVDGYDVCFVPQNFKIRLFSFFAIIIIIQNLLVLGLCLAGHKIGSYIFDIKQLRVTYETSLTSLTSKDIKMNEIEFFNKNDSLVIPKILSGVSVIIAALALATKKTVAVNTFTLSIKSYVLEIVPRTLILAVSTAHMLIFTSLASLSLTYFQSITKLLNDNLVYDYGSLPYTGKFLIYSYSLFINDFTFLFWMSVGTFIGFYNFRGLILLYQKLQENRRYKMTDLVKDLFKNYFLKQYTIWFKYFAIPFLLQHLVFGIAFFQAQRAEQYLGVDEKNNAMSVMEKAFYINLNMVISGRKVPLAILYKATFSGYVIFSFGKYLFGKLRVNWVRLKTITVDNTINNDEVIILEDES
ncbi:hypothetical protein ACO0SA_001091 [Hanseniaspora valbyensis]